MKRDKSQLASNWFCELRDMICNSYQKIEEEYSRTHNLKQKVFSRKKWIRNTENTIEDDTKNSAKDAVTNGSNGGGGEMSIMYGNVFEKVGVNISTVYGTFSEKFRKHIPNTQDSAEFFATGISLVSHPKSPFIPAMHFNTRYIKTASGWFGGGGDLTPIFPNESETASFHQSLKHACDLHDANYYPKFKKECDEYFFLKHRNEPRGVGGIFFDYLNTGNFDDDFAFVKNVGLAIYDIYPKIIQNKIDLTWSEEHRRQQLLKRGRYVEFNLLYDRGTIFGLETGGNIDAILMSLPPKVRWN